MRRHATEAADTTDAHGRSRIDHDLATRYPRALRLFARTFHSEDLSEPLPLPSTDVPLRKLPTMLKSGQGVPCEASLSDLIEALTRHDRCLTARAGRVGRPPHFAHASLADLLGEAVVVS